MNRKKLITYLLIALTLIMIIDLSYFDSNANIFEGFITESIQKIIENENSLFQNDYNQESIRAQKKANLDLGEDFLKEHKKIDSFVLKNDFGSIQLQGSQSPEIRIDYTLKIHAKNKEAAKKFIKSLELKANLEENNLVIGLNKSQTKTPEQIKVVEIDYFIVLPQTMKAVLANKYGQVQAQNLNSELKVSNHFGKTLINNIKKPIDLDLAYGQSEIKSITDLKLKSKYTDLKINNVKGKIKADLKYGELKLTDIEDLNLKAKYADINIKLVQDYEFYSYDLQTEYSEIELKAGALNFENKQELKYKGQQEKYEIIIDSKYGDINID